MTGGAGFIGSHLAEALCSKFDVTVLDSFAETTYGVADKFRNSQSFSAQGIKVIKADLCYDETYEKLPDFDLVIHLAAMPGLPLSWTNTLSYINNNIVATSKLIEHFKRQSKGKFLYVSTSSVYGRYALGDETSDTQPISPYGVTKLAAEKLLLAHFYESNLPISILRVFSVFGPRQRPDMMYTKLFEAAMNDELITVYGDGTQSRTNTYISDIVHGIELAIHNAIPGEIYNLGGGEEISLNEVISCIEDLTGKRIERTTADRRTGDQYRTVANIEKARRVLGYSPKIGVREGLSLQYDWMVKRQN